MGRINRSIAYSLAVLFVLGLVLFAGMGEDSLAGVRLYGKEEAQLRALGLAFIMYCVDNNCYPVSLQQLSSPISYIDQDALSGFVDGWNYEVINGGKGYRLEQKDDKSIGLLYDMEWARVFAKYPLDKQLKTLQQESDLLRQYEMLESICISVRLFEKPQQDKAVDVLLQFAEVPYKRLRAKAISGLATTKRAELLDLYINALKDEYSAVRAAGISGLMKLKKPEALPGLLSMLNDPEREVRLHAVKALKEFEGEKGKASLLVAIDDQDAEVREKAAEYIRIHNANDVQLALMDSLGDEVEEVRVKAVSSLALFSNRESMDSLLQCYSKESSDRVKKEIFYSLQEMGAGEELEKLTIDTDARIEFVKSDMEQIAKALESRYLDWSAYLVPDDVFNSDSVFSKRYESVGHKSIEQYRSYNFSRLTTPISYLKQSSIRDPFNNDFGEYYRYGTPVNNPYSGCMLISNGPDRDIDIRAEYVLREETEHNAREYRLYDEYPFEGNSSSLWDHVYDPTNGIVSDGDIVRLHP